MQLHSFDNTNTLDQYFAERMIDILSQAIAARGQAYLVVSGGRTPKGLFEALAQAPLDWSHVTVILADERLSATEKERNECLVRAHLLQHHAAAAHFIGLQDALSNELDIDAQIAALPRFDAVILGMGEDGHTASLFPCCSRLHIGLDDASSRAIFRAEPESAPYERISLTKNRLLNSRAHFLHLVGHKKLSVFNQAMLNDDPLVMPIRAFLHAPTADVQVMYSP